MSDVGSALGVVGGLKAGGVQGDAAAGISAARLGANLNAFGSASGEVGAGAAGAGNVLGIVSGLERGGASGYGGAAINAAQLGNQLGMFGSQSSDVASVLGPAAAALAVYNFASTWQSGKTGSDALSGAEAGAAIGSVVPGIGTVIGGVIGGAVGAISSAFGPGAKDPEQYTWQNYFSEYQKNPKALAQITPPQAFQTLAGIFDARSSDVPIYAQFGRMGEGAFVNAMATKINQATASGQIAPGATPQEIYSKVIDPWIQQMPNAAGEGGKGWAKGGGYGGDVPAIKNLITTLIGQYTGGQLTNQTPIGINGQIDHTLPTYVGHVMQPNPAKLAAQSNLAPLTTALTTFPGAKTGPSTASTLLPALLAMPGLTGANMANVGTQNQMFAGGPGGDPGGPFSSAPSVSTGPDTSQTDPSADPGAGNITPPAAATPANDPSFLSSLASGVSSFLSSPLGSLAEFGTLAGVGLSQASSQKATNDALAGSLSTLGQPFTETGKAITNQLQGGAPVAGPMGASISDQTTAAAQLGAVAKEYTTGNLTDAQKQTVSDFVKQQRAMVDTQLAASGNTDSSARDAAYQQIDAKAAELSQSLIQGDIQIGAAALTQVQQTYSTLLNQALSSSEFGLGAQEAAVTLQIQSDTQLSQSLNALFGEIAKGFGTAMRGPAGGTGAPSAGGGVGGAIAGALRGVAGSASGGGGRGVAASPGGGGSSPYGPDNQPPGSDTSLTTGGYVDPSLPQPGGGTYYPGITAGAPPDVASPVATPGVGQDPFSAAGSSWMDPSTYDPTGAYTSTPFDPTQIGSDFTIPDISTGP
jgi:hypothetical protein